MNFYRFIEWYLDRIRIKHFNTAFIISRIISGYFMCGKVESQLFLQILEPKVSDKIGNCMAMFTLI